MEHRELRLALVVLAVIACLATVGIIVLAFRTDQVRPELSALAGAAVGAITGAVAAYRSRQPERDTRNGADGVQARGGPS